MSDTSKTNRNYFFQSTASEDKNTRRQKKLKNKSGDPLRLTGKVSAVVRDSFGTTGGQGEEGEYVFIADNGGVVRRWGVDSRKTTHLYLTPSPSAPLTSLATHPTSPTIYAGSWDHNIYAWHASTRALQTIYTGHADFVKCLLCTRLLLPTTTDPTASTDNVDSKKSDENMVLVSGSADGTLILWSACTGQKIHVVRAHTRGVLDIAVDPTSIPSTAAPEEIVLYSASSLGDIKRWRISSTQFLETPEGSISAHETSVNRLHFAPQEDGGEAALWTASSDNTAALLPRQTTTTSPCISSSPTLRLQHPDWVRDVAVDEVSGLVVTACRDEEVRVWDAEDGGLVGLLSGHFDAVEAVCLVDGAGGKGGRRVVSGGLDGTVRVWSLERGGLEKTLVGEEERGEGFGEVEDDAEEEKEEEKGGKVFTTEDEDRELAELMADDDDL